MAKARFIHDGDSIDFRAGANVSAGDVVVQGDLIGIAKIDIPAGNLGALAVTGVFDIETDGTLSTAGSKAYWNVAQKVATDSDGGGTNKYLGKLVRDWNNEATVRIRLEQ